MDSGPTSPVSPPYVPAGTLALALLASVVRAGALFAAHIASGSSALLTASVHALIEASSQTLMLTGHARVKSRSELWEEPRATYELAFWGPVAGTLLYALGAGVAIYEGARTIVAPRGLDKSDPALLALAAAILVTMVMLWQLRTLVRRRLPADATLALPRGMGPPLVLALGVELRAALVGLSAAALGSVAASRLGVVGADGAASIAIGLIMAATAAGFAVEVKALLSRDRTSRDPMARDRKEPLPSSLPPPEAPSPGAPLPEGSASTDSAKIAVPVPAPPVAAVPSMIRIPEARDIGPAVAARTPLDVPNAFTKPTEFAKTAESPAADGSPGDDPPTGAPSSNRKARKKARRRHS